RRYTFNTAVAAIMELLNAVTRNTDEDAATRAVKQEAFENIVRLLAPIAPHICEALWHELGHAESVMTVEWPKLDEAALVRESVEIVVQVNGKLRGRISVPVEAERAHLEQAAMAEPNVRKYLEGKPVKKVVVVPGKLVNLVVSP
ncbi:MAG: class I tRNA ligase family protein, partial [Gammaproteobacteria bacterium]|nr:class I tRNA ligase family protein [Gammaproteobacteria bacterium]MDE2108125.1 class I tRNA ligase family protein [Gammaproteobacteria bacterium]